MARLKQLQVEDPIAWQEPSTRLRRALAFEDALNTSRAVVEAVKAVEGKASNT